MDIKLRSTAEEREKRKRELTKSWIFDGGLEARLIDDVETLLAVIRERDNAQPKE